MFITKQLPEIIVSLNNNQGGVQQPHKKRGATEKPDE
jgi:hypothetical protein